MTFSLLDFDTNRTPDTVRLMKYCTKFISPTRRSISWLPRKKRHDICLCRTIVSHYDIDNTIKVIEETIRSASVRQRRNTPLWRNHINLIKGLRNEKV